MISNTDGYWEQIFPEGGYPYEINDNPECPLPGGTPCYSAYQDWSEAVFDLSDYSGIVQLMFRFASDGLVTDEGWYVDDVSVTSNGICGDANNDGAINLLDITFLIRYLYQSGPAPDPIELGDANCNSMVNLLDITFLIAYLYQSGPEPICN
jgi:hypothetical protein